MESSIAAFLMRWSACELLPTIEACTCMLESWPELPLKYRFSTGGQRRKTIGVACVGLAGKLTTASNEPWAHVLAGGRLGV